MNYLEKIIYYRDHRPWLSAFGIPIILIFLPFAIIGLSMGLGFERLGSFLSPFISPVIFLGPIWVFYGLFFSKKRFPYFLCVLLFGSLKLLVWLADESYTNSARRGAVKSNQVSVIKYINAELQKCSSGETTAMSGKLMCSEMKTLAVVTSVASAFSKFKNPYSIPNNAITIGGNNLANSDLGYIRLIASKNEIIVKACFDTPCKKKENQLESYIQIKE